jgi:hypothetical protein
MRLNPDDIRAGLKTLKDTDPELSRDALAYIRQLEGDLRRAGFTEYNDPTDRKHLDQ